MATKSILKTIEIKDNTAAQALYNTLKKADEEADDISAKKTLKNYNKDTDADKDKK